MLWIKAFFLHPSVNGKSRSFLLVCFSTLHLFCYFSGNAALFENQSQSVTFISNLSFLKNSFKVLCFFHRLIYQDQPLDILTNDLFGSFYHLLLGKRLIK